MHLLIIAAFSSNLFCSVLLRQSPKYILDKNQFILTFYLFILSIVIIIWMCCLHIQIVVDPIT